MPPSGDHNLIMESPIPKSIYMFFLIGFFSLLSCGRRESASVPLVYPYLQNVTSDGATVMWETGDSVIGKVRYGAPGSLEQLVTEQKPETIHKLRLLGLNADSTYSYRAEYSSTKLGESHFRTFPKDGSRPWRMAVYGDSRSNPEKHAAIIRGIIKANPLLVMHTGDYATDGRIYGQWKPQFFDPAAELLKSVPLFPVIGNHEYNSPWYYRYFDLDFYHAGQAYYSFDVANAHIVLLNSDAPYADWDMNSGQMRWLIEDLEKHAAATWKIVTFHHPPFSARNLRPVIPQRWVWHPVFEQHGVDIVFNGHDHHYFRTYAVGTTEPRGTRTGIPYIITGGGGAPLEGAEPQDYGAFIRKGNHFTTVDFEADRLTLRAIDDSGVFDSLTIHKGFGLSPEQFASYPAMIFKLNLANAIYKSTPFSIRKGMLKGRLSLEVPTYFKIPLNVELHWKNADSYAINHCRFNRLLKPGDTLKLKCDLESSSVGSSPTPIAQVLFSLPGGGKPFINDTVNFFPFKIRKTDPLTAAHLSQSPVMDGAIGELEWKESKPLMDFFPSVRQIVTGGLERTTLVRLGHSGDTLFVSAVVTGITSPTRSEKRKRDDLSIMGDDCFAVSLGLEKKVFVFVATSSGSLLDALNKNPEWNGGIDYSVQGSESAWTVEMAIPLSQFGPGVPKAINLSRWENNGLSADEWNPTYSPINRSYSLPAFGIDMAEPAAMVPLVLTH